MSDFTKSIQTDDAGRIKLDSSNRVQLAFDGPLPDLLCDSVSASKRKCGYGEFVDPSEPPKYYLTLTLTRSGSFSAAAFSYNQTVTHNKSAHYDTDTCEEVIDSETCDSTSPDCHDTSCVSCGHDCGCWLALSTIGAACPGGSGFPYTIDYTQRTIHDYSSGGSGDCGGSDDALTTISDEYTTEMLVAKTEAALPGYSGCWNCIDEDGNPCELADGQGCDCAASRNLSEDESSLTLQNFKYKFKMSDDDPKPPAGATLFWNETFVPDLEDGSPDPNPDNWVDNQRSYTFDGETRETPVFECRHPDTNGEITINDERWS